MTFGQRGGFASLVGSGSAPVEGIPPGEEFLDNLQATHLDLVDPAATRQGSLLSENRPAREEDSGQIARRRTLVADGMESLESDTLYDGRGLT